MLGDRWICDRVPTERFPDYTRGNAGEVLAEPVSPLAWTLLLGAGPGAGLRRRVRADGRLRPHRVRRPARLVRPVRRLLLQLAHPVAPVRRALRRRLGSGRPDVLRQRPARRSRRTSKPTGTSTSARPRSSAATMGWVSTTDSVPEAELQKLEAKAAPRQPARPRPRRPTSNSSPGRSASNATSACSSRSVVWASMGSSVGPGVLPALLGEVEPEAIAKLMTGIGDVDSAGIAAQIFDISRIVRGSAELTAAFDGDLDGLLDRLAASGSDRRQAVPRRGRRRSCTTTAAAGPNEWDVYQRSYETNPTMLLQAIERTRHADDDANPARSLAAGRRRASTADRQVRGGVRRQRGGARRVPDRGAHASGVDGGPRAHQVEQHPLPQRGADVLRRARPADGRARPPRPRTADLHAPRRRARRLPGRPGSFTARLAEREQDYLSLYELEPPYIVNGVVAAAAGVEAPRRGRRTSRCRSATCCTGVAGSPGEATGTARIMLDLSDPTRAASPATS